MKVGTAEITGSGHPRFAGIRQRHSAFTATTAVELNRFGSSDRAGLVILQNNTTYYALLVSASDGGQVVRLIKKDVGADPELRAELALGTGPVFLRIEGDGGECGFSCSLDGVNWQTVSKSEDARILSTRHAGGFVGAFIGLYVHSEDRSSAAYADFDWFEYQGRDRE